MFCRWSCLCQADDEIAVICQVAMLARAAGPLFPPSMQADSMLLTNYGLDVLRSRPLKHLKTWRRSPAALVSMHSTLAPRILPSDLVSIQKGVTVGGDRYLLMKTISPLLSGCGRWPKLTARQRSCTCSTRPSSLSNTCKTASTESWLAQRALGCCPPQVGLPS